jgi:hypothetical protein
MRRIPWLVFGVALLALAGLALRGLPAGAQSPQQTYSLSWWTADGGGGHSTAAGSYTLDGTAGQPDAGPRLSGGNYLLNGGFWPGGVGWQVRHAIYLPIVLRGSH